MIDVMTKKKPTPGGESKKPYPSRAKTRYYGIPIEMAKILEEIATKDDRSVSWLLRKLVQKELTSLGLWPPTKPAK